MKPANTTAEGEKGNPFYKQHKIPKKSGGVRLVYETSSEHPRRAPAALILKSLTSLLFSKFPWPEFVDAYVNGKSIRDSAEKHAGCKTAVFLDIEDFFGSVRRSMIRHALGQQFLMHFNMTKFIASLVTLERRLPQGSPIASHMANLVALNTFDYPIYNEALKNGWRYSRYSDDIILSHEEHKSDEEVKEIIEMAKNAIETAGFCVKREKTRVAGTGPGRLPSVRWLGYTINEKPNISKEDYRNLRQILYFCATRGYASQAEIAGVDTEKFIMMIKGRFNFVKGALADSRVEKLAEYIDQADALEAINMIASDSAM
jgi:hypothetical protein